MTRAERVIEFIQRYCLVPDGAQVGQPLVLDEFQKEFIRAIYDNPAGTRTWAGGSKGGRAAAWVAAMAAAALSERLRLGVSFMGASFLSSQH